MIHMYFIREQRVTLKIWNFPFYFQILYYLPKMTHAKKCIRVVKNVNLRSKQMVLACLIRYTIWDMFQRGKNWLKCSNKNLQYVHWLDIWKCQKEPKYFLILSHKNLISTSGEHIRIMIFKYTKHRSNLFLIGAHMLSYPPCTSKWQCSILVEEKWNAYWLIFFLLQDFF